MLHILTFRKKINKQNNGFTIVEMLIIAPIVILVIGTFIYTVVKLTGDVMATRAANTLAYDIQDALNRIEQDLTLSKEFLSTNNITITSPQGSNNVTAPFTISPNPTLILNTYTTKNNPMDSSRTLIYTKTPNACGTSLETRNEPLMSNTVYFTTTNISTNVTTLWRRVIMPANYNTIGCSTPWQQPSCQTAAPTYPICKAMDIKLLNDISTFSIAYYKKDQLTPAGTPAEAETAKVTITVGTTSAGRDISQTGTVRATKLNSSTSP
ncbi:MAG: hypothetical protein WCQ49_03205 [Candidatus Saccharibacteria bacterium]